MLYRPHLVTPRTEPKNSARHHLLTFQHLLVQNAPAQCSADGSGKALWDGFLVESHFSVNVFKFLLHREDSIGLDDMSLVDEVLSSSLQWLLDNDVDALDINFVIYEEEFGACRQVALKEVFTHSPVD